MTKEEKGFWNKTKKITENVWEDTKEVSEDVWEETKHAAGSVKKAFTHGNEDKNSEKHSSCHTKSSNERHFN